MIFDLKDCVPLSSVLKAIEGKNFVSARLCQISDAFYLHFSDSRLIKKSIGVDELVVVGVLWAPSVPAALRAICDDIEGDDYSVDDIPEGFFPFEGLVGYDDFLRGIGLSCSGIIEAASYRFSDGAFVYKYIQGGGFKVFFRDSADNPLERPFAALKRLNWKR